MSPVAGDIPKRAHSNVNSWRETKNAIDVLNQRIDELIPAVGGLSAPSDLAYILENATDGADVTLLANRRILAAGTNITLTDGGAGSTLTIAASGITTDAFKTINCPTGEAVADSADDTLNLTTANAHLTITGDSATDTVDFAIVTGTSGTKIPLLDGANTWSANQLLSSANELQFNNSSNRVYALSSTILIVDANVELRLDVGGVEQLVITTATASAVEGDILMVDLTGGVNHQFKGIDELTDGGPGLDISADFLIFWDTTAGKHKRTVPKWIVQRGSMGAANGTWTQGEVLIADSTSSVAWTILASSDLSNSSNILLADGTVGLSANWDAGAFQIRALTFQSDVATGVSPPLVVASTDKVINFDSDSVDGLHVATSGNALGALDGANTWSAAQKLSGATKFNFRDTGQYVNSASLNRMNIGAVVTIRFEINGTEQVRITDGAIVPEVTNDIDLGSTAFLFKDAYLAGKLYFDDTFTQIQGVSGDMKFDLATGKDYVFQDAGTPVLTINKTLSTFVNPVQFDGAAEFNSTIQLDGAATFNSTIAINDVTTVATDKKLLFRDSANWIHSPGSNVLLINAETTLILGIGNGVDLTLTSGQAVFTQDVRASHYTSTITTGTQPYACTSKTLNTNFNAEFTGGKTAAELNPTTTKGDLIGFTTVEVRIPIGTNDHVLTADSTVSAGLKWAAAAGGSSPVTVATTQVFSGTSPSGSWANLDLSGTIGSNVAVVVLSFKSSSDMNAIAVRTDGDVNDYYDAAAEGNAYGLQLGHHDSTADLVLQVAASSSGIIEWTTESAQTCTVDILWYIK